jgi:pyruvoyl-dependent arginine decarboxylase-like protein
MLRQCHVMLARHADLSRHLRRETIVVRGAEKKRRGAREYSMTQDLEARLRIWKLGYGARKAGPRSMPLITPAVSGIGNVNLPKTSSIVPPNTRSIALPRLKPGVIIPTAYAAMSSEVPGEVITAAVGWALPENREKAGVINAVHDKATRAEPENSGPNAPRGVSFAARRSASYPSSRPSIRSNAQVARSLR